jgi:type I restriction enzyme S subunit
MSTDLLFGQFTTLATAPEGISELRNLILNLAFLGQLGTYDEKDESAKTTIERFFSQNKQTSKLGISPKFKNIDPNNLPKTWIQLPLINVLSALESGSRPLGGVRDIESGIPSIGGEHLNGNGGFRFEKIKFVSHDFYQKMSRGKIRVNDILVVKDGATTGKVSLVKPNFPFTEACINEHVFICRFIDCIYPPYAFYYLFSENGKKRILENFKGSTQGGINLGFADKTIIPIAPLAEQHRIVAKVDRLMALCDELEARQLMERASCLRLGTASLAGLQNAESPEEVERLWAQVCDAFDPILDCPENVAVLRQTILQLAFRGKLSEQLTVDESAHILLKRIEKNAQKNTNKKYLENLSKLKEIDHPTIPKSWTWCNLNSIFTFVTSGSRGWAEYYSTEGALFIRIGNITRNSISLDMSNIQRVAPPESAEKNRTLVHKNDILVTITADIGSIGFVSKDIGEAYINQHIALCRPVSEVDPEYLAWYLLSNAGGKRQLSELKRGGTKIGLGLDDIKAIFLPLPPLAEQHRIVAKVDALMALCDALESRLKERAGVQGQVAGAVVKQVARGV